MEALDLHTAVAATCPIKGVWIGDPMDKSTWGAWYDGANEAQQAAAQAIIDNFE